MHKCPKCGSYHISGPSFESECSSGGYVWNRERLRYTCLTCGYSMMTPTKDSAERPASAGLSER